MRNRAAGNFVKLLSSLVVATFVVFCSACSDAPSGSAEPSVVPTALERKLQPNMLPEIEAALDCEDVRYMHDDVYFHDSMKGLYCMPEVGDEYATELRIYTESESPAQTLDEQEGVVGENAKLLFGKNWYAVGSVKQLEAIADAVGVETILWSTLPEPTPETERDGMIDSCATAAVTLIRSRVVDGSDDVPKSSLESSEEYFPNIGRHSKKIANEIVRDNPEVTDTEFEFVVTNYGPRIKRFCRYTQR